MGVGWESYLRHSPVQVSCQVGFHVGRVKACERAGVDGSKERRSKWNRTSDLKVVCLISLTFPTMGGGGVVDEDAVTADEVGLKGPLERIGVEVAEEDMDEKGGVESILLDSNIGDPFTILAILGGGMTGNGLVSRIRCLLSDHDGRLFIAGTVESSRRNQPRLDSLVNILVRWVSSGDCRWRAVSVKIVHCRANSGLILTLVRGLPVE